MAFIAAATTSRTFQCPENSLTHNIHLLFSYFFFHRRCRCLPPPFHVLQSGKKYSSLFIFFFNIFIGLFFSFFFVARLYLSRTLSSFTMVGRSRCLHRIRFEDLPMCEQRKNLAFFEIQNRIEMEWNEMFNMYLIASGAKWNYFCGQKYHITNEVMWHQERERETEHTLKYSARCAQIIEYK